MAGIEDADVPIIRNPDNNNLVMLTGDYNEMEDCPDEIMGKKYTLLVIHTDDSACSISRIYSEDDFEEQNLCQTGK